MDPLDAFIQEQKKEVKEIRGTKRWMRQSDIEEHKRRAEEEFFEEEAKRRKLEEIRKLKDISDAFDSKDKKSGGDDEGASKPDISLSNRHIIRLLRKMREPIRLFGETDLQRYERLEELQLSRNELKLREQNIFGNVLRGRLKGDAMELMEVEGIDSFTGIDSPSVHSKVRKGTKSDEAVAPKDGSHGDTGNSRHTVNADSNYSVDLTGHVDKPRIIQDWILRTMKEWNAEIEMDHESDDSAKKIKRATYMQTVRDLKPLEKKLKQRTLDPDVLDKLFKVVSNCIEHKFKEAHDAYMLLAIGNAAWPMGVTMVGIHERAGRSKIFSSEVAHILNDETTRKYIQMVKRLMSFAQRRYCTDPSKTVKLSTIHI